MSSAIHLADVPGLLPRTPDGHQFVAYGDCCSGVPGTENERRFRAVNAALQRLAPRPEFICFLGDHVAGLTPDVNRLREQWRYFHAEEFSALEDAGVDVYHLTSNHDTYSAESVAVWRGEFPALPQNGPRGEAGLTYWVRRGSLLLVVLNTASLARQGEAGIAEDVGGAWLEAVLTANEDAAHKLVFGHHPIHPVNGYRQAPKWCVPADEGARVWNALLRHRVLAYICSHIIAFDVQVHHGVLQITSGGAGTVYGPGGAMPCPPEYNHFVQLAVDGLGLRLQARDAAGGLREWLAWPPAQGAAMHAMELSPGGVEHEIAPPDDWHCGAGTAHMLAWRFTLPRQPTTSERCDLLSARGVDGGRAFDIGIHAGALAVRRHDASGSARWDGPRLPAGPIIDIEVAIHTGMGPGGVLWRLAGASTAWSSMTTASATGFENFPWCGRWHFSAAARVVHWHTTDTIDDHSHMEMS